jgi:hypothetical protein
MASNESVINKYSNSHSLTRIYWPDSRPSKWHASRNVCFKSAGEGAFLPKTYPVCFLTRDAKEILKGLVWKNGLILPIRL